ncbi:MAG: hypothetical protein IT317_14765 [Anaerolineales bacterium]|nr:hypothetical protein [Anaerolineales bacterium]
MRRPRRLTLLAWAFWAVAAFNLLGLVTGVQRYTVLRDLPLSVSPVYLLGSRALWAAAFALVGAALWRQLAWARPAVWAALALYLAQGWLDRLFLARAEAVRLAWPYHLVLQLIGLLLVAALLSGRPHRRAISAKGAPLG